MILFTLGTGLQAYWTAQVGTMEWRDNGYGALVENVVRPSLVGVGEREKGEEEWGRTRMRFWMIK